MKVFERVVIQRPWLVIGIVLAVTIAFVIAMAGNMRLVTDLDEYMPADHPAFRYSDQAEEWFDIKDGILIAIEAPGGIYNPGTLRKIRDITEALRDMEGVDRADVNSLYTADNIVGTEDGLDVTPFYTRVPTDAAGLEALRSAVASNEMVFGRFVSKDETSAIVVAEIADGVFSQDFYREVVSLARGFEGPERIYVAGRPIVEGTLATLMPRDMSIMAPLVVVVITAVMLLLLRSARSAFLALSVVLLSTVWTFGLMAALRVPIYSVSTMIPVMLIAIGVAYAIHIFSQLQLIVAEDPDVERGVAVAAAVRLMFRPVLMTALTTAVGFVSLLTSQVYPVKYFGLFTAFGVMVAMTLALVLVPAGVMILGWRRSGVPPSGQTSGGSFAHRFARAVVAHRALTVAATAVVLGLSAWGITRVWINSSFLDNFQRNSDIVRTDRFVNYHFGGTSTLNVILESPDNDAFKSPDLLRAVAGLQRDLEGLDMVGSTFGLTDYLERMNKVMHADDPAWERVPDTSDLIAQYLLLYEMSGDPRNLERVVDYDYRRANLTVQLKADDTRTIQSALAVVERHRDEMAGFGLTVGYAGSGYKSKVFADLILQGQISSLGLSLAIVVGLIALMFRSLLVGLIGSVPIAVAAALNFGVMGALGIPLSVTTALIASIAVGIGIDYAIHFIERYREHAARTGDAGESGARTMHETGRAILFNALAVVAGFLVLMFSVFPPNRMLGALVSLNMAGSFVGTVTVMYAVLFVAGIGFRRGRVAREAAGQDEVDGPATPGEITSNYSGGKR